MLTFKRRQTLCKEFYFAILLILFNFFSAEKSWCQVTLPSNFNDALVVGGWNNVEGFQFDAIGRMYVWEKAGKVWIVDTNGVKQATPLLDISEEVGDWRDHGLNGFALDPNFNTNGYFYLMYTVDRHHLLKFGTAQYNAATNEYYNATIIRVTRYTANPATNFTTTVNNSRLVLIGETKKTGIPLLHESHSGGSLVFGTDGSLLISTGDGASYNVTDVGSSSDTYWSQGLTDSIIRTKENVGAYRAQMVDCLNGKVLRINPANGDGLPTNPFYDAANPRAAKSRVWSLGLRNPFRMVLKPASGSTDITAGNPGVLYIGDVQWSTWEDLNVSNAPGQNFGWPAFEGLTRNTSYSNSTVQNMDAPNPLYGTGGCTQQYFTFVQLINQDTIGTPLWKNPCNAAQTIPSNIPKFIHTRPALDWAHGNQSRTGTFSGTSAATVNIYSAGSPVSGPQFGGNASVGGVWYTGNKYPLQYQNKYFHADYGGAWIKMFDFNAQNKPVSVSNFGGNMGAVVFVAMNPKTKEINYIKYSDQIRKITYSLSVNNPPVAVASQNQVYGASPLLINFNGSASTDPENQPLSYSWNFGDGGTSTSANPPHTFSAPAGVPTTYTVTLTVTDNVAQTSIATLKVYVNNTPPQVTITSFNNGDLFSVSNPTTLPLQASVTDLEHGPGQLFYSWTTSLHHNNHTHPETPDTNKTTTTFITPVNCDDTLNVYSYDIKLIVTDAAGLSTTVQQSIYPACAPPLAAFTANQVAVCQGANVSFTNQSLNLPDSYIWSFPGGNPSSSTSTNPTVNYATPGVYAVSLTATSTRGTNTMQKAGYITVNALPVVSAGSYSPVCTNSGLIQLAGTPAGGTYSGSGVSGGVFNPGIGQGTYSITYNYTNANGCSNSASGNITVNSVPVVVAGTYGPVCVNGSTIVLSGTPSGGTFSGPGVSGVNFNPALAGVGTHTISYSYTNANGCSNSASTTIPVYGQPTVNAGTYPALCQNGSPISLIGSPVGGAFSGTGVSSNTFNPALVPNGNYVISYSYTDVNGCSGSATTNILVNSLPSVNAGLFPPVCVNSGIVHLTGNPAGGIYSGTGVSNNTFDPSSGAGTYLLTYSYTDANGCSNSATTTIVVNPLPVVNAGSYNPVCDNSSLVSLAGSPSGGLFGGNGVNGNSFNPSLTGSGLQAISYIYVDANGCSNSASASILVNPSPTVSAGIYSPVCINGGVVNLNGIPSGGVFSGNGVSGNVFDPLTVGPGTNSVTYFFTDVNGCSNTSVSAVTVYGLPAVSAGNYIPVCHNGGIVNLSGFPVGGTFSGPGVTSNVFDPSIGAGSYIINYVYTDGDGCSNSDTALIVVNNCNCAVPLQPSGITITGGSSKVCPGETRTYSVILKSGVVYNWIIPSGAVISNGQGTNIINVSFNSSFTQATASISVTAANSCGSSPVRTISISRNNPVTPTSVTGLVDGVCNQSNVPYSTSNVAGMAYNWSFSSAKGSVISGQGTSSIAANFTNGFTTVNLSVTTNNACGTSSPRTIIIKPTPGTPSGIIGSSSPCVNQSGVPYSVSPVIYATKYLWTAPTGSHITDGIINGGVTLTTGSNAVSVSFGNVATKVICNAGNVCGYGSQSALNISFSCREAEFAKESENLIEGSIQVYPNPTKGKIEAEYFSGTSENVTIKIVNVIGQNMIIKNLISHQGINKVSFDFSDYPKGIYLLEWSNGQVQHYAKIVVE